MPAISVVLPVHNGQSWLERVLAAIRNAPFAGEIEIVAIDDGSTDDSHAILTREARHGDLTLLDGERRGAAAALNLGIRTAKHPLIAQIDQDVVISPQWFEQLSAALEDASVAAAQGHYVAAPDAGPFARVMGLDLRQRYESLGAWTNHVCTGNSIYRKSALVDVGLFDETLGYGYDNDLSYRLTDAGYKLAFVPAAESTHYWREGILSYARQQYGFGYGRLDLVAKHRRRLAGDNVSRLSMMLHGPAMATAMMFAALAIGLGVMGRSPLVPGLAAALIVGALAAERLVAGFRATAKYRDRAGLWFAPAHLVRDAAWAAAIVVWTMRRGLGARARPADSMAARR